MIWEEKNIVYEHQQGPDYIHIKNDKRFEVKVFSGVGSKDKMKRYLENNKHLTVVGQVNDVKGYRRFIPFINWSDAWKRYFCTNIQKRYMYEIILSDRICKPYMDIEWKKSEYNKPTEFIETITHDIIDIFKNRYKKELTNDDIFITKAHSSEKYSFHLTITPKEKLLVYKTNRHRNNDSAWDLYVALIEKNKELYEGKIDKSVYSLDREMRCIYSTKFDQLRPFIPINGPEYINKKNEFVENYLDYFITNIDREYEYIRTPKYEETIKEKKFKECKKYNEKESDDFIVIRIKELLQTVHPTAVFTNKTKDNGYRFSYSNKMEPCFTGVKHKNNGFAVFLNPYTGILKMFCYSQKCSRLFKLGHLYYDVTYHIGALLISEKYIEYHDIGEKGVDVDDINYLVSDFLSSIIKHGGVIAIKSPMGTGKTQCLLTIIEKFLMDKRILYLSHRQSFSKNIEGTFKNLGFYNYMTNDGYLFEKNKVIVQIDSLNKLNRDGNHRAFDFIIMDEIVSLLYHLNSTTLKDRLFICDLIEKYISKATGIIALDADFNQTAYDWLTIVKEKPRVLINKIEPGTKRMFLFTSNYDLRKLQILEDIKNDKKVVIISLSLENLMTYMLKHVN